MVEYIGYAASALFAFCGLPQAIKAYRTKSAEDVSMLFLLMWGGAEELMPIYVYATHGFDVPLMANYFLNLVFVCVILRYKVKPKTEI